MKDLTGNIKICKHGAVLKTDANGYLIPDVGLDKIVSPWDAAVNFVKDAYIQHLGDQLHSVYIRGSVARGLAVEGLSDLDSFALVHGHRPKEKKALTWAGEVRKEYRKRFPFSVRPEIWIEWASLLLDNLQTGAWWWMKIGSVCVHGEDLIPQIPPVKLETIVERSKIQPQYITKMVKDVQDALKKNNDIEHTKDYCRWICKEFLRAGSSLVIARAKGFTRDLYHCYALFAQFYPQQEKAMYQALEFSLNPTGNRDELAPFVDKLGTFLAREAAVFRPPRN